MIKMGIRNPERAIAFARGLKVLAFDFTIDMYVFMEMSKRVQVARLMNDGQTYKNSLASSGGGVTNTTPGLFTRGVTMDGGTIRAVEKMYGMYKRDTTKVEYAPLVNSTIRYFREPDYPYPEFPRLYRTGKMIQSGISHGYGHFEHAWGQGFMFGANNRMAWEHNTGSGGQKERRFFYMDSKTMFHIMKTLHLRILSAFRMMRAKTLGGI